MRRKSTPSGFLKSNGTLIANVAAVLLFVVVMVAAFLILKPNDTVGVFNDRPPVPQPLRMTQQAALNSYGWVDKPGNIAHIPIDRAMQILVTQGMPTLAPLPTPQATPTP